MKSSRENTFGKTMILSESDLQGTITQVNTNLCEVSGYTREELIGKPIGILQHADMPMELLRICREFIAKGKVFNAIIKNRKKDDTAYWVDSIIVPIKDKDGQVLKYVDARYLIPNENLALLMYNKRAGQLGLPSLLRSRCSSF